MTLSSVCRMTGSLSITYTLAALAGLAQPAYAGLIKNPDFWERVPGLVHDLIC